MSRHVTSAQHGRKLKPSFDSQINLWSCWPQVPYLTSAQLGQKFLRRVDSWINLCSIWSQVGVYRVNFWSWWPEVLSENCIQVGHNFTSDQVGPKLWYKINLWPCWSQVEKAGSKSVAKLTILFTSSHHGTKCVRMLYATITSSQLGTKFALCIIFNRNFVASCNKVPALIIPNLGIIFRTQN